ncbi:MAG: hypothetical protein HY291_12455 [Planctomycetes bacterium]|nr:hypothetical protein [Planctomycetota bacterium]
MGPYRPVEPPPYVPVKPPPYVPPCEKLKDWNQYRTNTTPQPVSGPAYVPPTGGAPVYKPPEPPPYQPPPPPPSGPPKPSDYSRSTNPFSGGFVNAGEPQPYKDPWELYERLRYYLGIGMGPKDEPPAVTPMQTYLDQKEKVLEDYKSEKSGKKKEGMRGQLLGLRRDMQMRLFQVEDRDFVQRRMYFIDDVLLSIQCVSSPYLTYSHVFRCAMDNVQSDGLRILKDMPVREVAFAVWGRLEEQARLTPESAKERVTALDRERDGLLKKIKDLQHQTVGNKNQAAVTDLWNLIDACTARIEAIAYERHFMESAAQGKNAKFKDILSGLLGGMGEDAVDAASRGMLLDDPEVRREAAGVLRKVGAKAVPFLIVALQQKPDTVIAGVLQNITGQRFGAKAGDWAEWWLKEHPADKKVEAIRDSKKTEGADRGAPKEPPKANDAELVIGPAAGKASQPEK